MQNEIMGGRKHIPQLDRLEVGLLLSGTMHGTLSITCTYAHPFKHS